MTSFRPGPSFALANFALRPRAKLCTPNSFRPPPWGEARVAPGRSFGVRQVLARSALRPGAKFFGPRESSSFRPPPSRAKLATNFALRPQGEVRLRFRPPPSGRSSRRPRAKVCQGEVRFALGRSLLRPGAKLVSPQGNTRAAATSPQVCATLPWASLISPWVLRASP